MEPYLESMRLKGQIKDSSNIRKFFKRPAKPIALSTEPAVS